MEQPVYHWNTAIAHPDMTFHTGKAFLSWQGGLLIGSLRPGPPVRLTLTDGQVAREERYLSGLGEHIRDV